MDLLTKELERKALLSYEMNSIEKYIKEGNCDQSLQEVFDKITKELGELDSKIERLSDPTKKDLELKRQAMLHEITGHEIRIAKLKKEIQDLEHLLQS